MKEEIVKIRLPEGVFETKVSVFDKSDKAALYRIYRLWRLLSSLLSKINARAINLPEGLSEGAFCLEMGVVRITDSISGANTSFDCFNLEKNERIQVKACSVLPDLTSFGPKSVWDKLYFVDFYREGKWDGTFDIYLIDNSDIYEHKVNRTQTLRDQQIAGRRPRFSIFTSVIKAKELKPIKTGSLNS